jgi:chorismate mutase
MLACELRGRHMSRADRRTTVQRNTLRHNLFRSIYVVRQVVKDRTERLCQDDNENHELLESTNVSTFSEPGIEDHPAGVDGEQAAGSPFGGRIAGHRILRVSVRSELFARIDTGDSPDSHTPLLWRAAELAGVLDALAVELRSSASPPIGDVMTTRFRSQAAALAIAGSLSIRVLDAAPPSLADNPSPSPLFALVDAAAQRLQTADPVAAAKYKTGGSVDDPQREQQVIDSVAKAAAAKQIDTGYVRAIFRNQIDATDAIEHARFAQWKLDPSAAPATAPDLSTSRTTIDRLNQTMVNEIAAHWDSLHAPSCGSDLDNALNAVVTARQLGDLYQRALTYATHSYCST